MCVITLKRLFKSDVVKNKKKDENRADRFLQVIISYKDKEENHYIFNAAECFIEQNSLVLKDGTIQNRVKDKWYITEFEDSSLSLDQFFGSGEKQDKAPKFLTMHELGKQKEKHIFRSEMYKRYSQILWALLLPFAALFLMLLLAHKRSNLLRGLIIGGSLFLFSYVSTSLIQVLFFPTYFSLFLLFSAAILALLISYLLFKRRWGY